MSKGLTQTIITVVAVLVALSVVAVFAPTEISRPIKRYLFGQG